MKKLRMAHSAQVPSKLAVVKKEERKEIIQDKNAHLLHRSSTNEVNNKFRMRLFAGAFHWLIKSREIPRLLFLIRDRGCMRFAVTGRAKYSHVNQR